MALNPLWHRVSARQQGHVAGRHGQRGAGAIDRGRGALCRHGPFRGKPISRAWFAVPGAGPQLFGSGAASSPTRRRPTNPSTARRRTGRSIRSSAWLATTVIASQAVISGAFSVTRQAMQLGFVPRMEVQHTSEKEQGQISPAGGQLGPDGRRDDPRPRLQVVEQPGAAYGIAVTGDMVIHLHPATVVAAKVWGWGWGRAGLLFTCFLAVELVFLTANILGIPDGGWFPLVAGMAVFVLMTTLETRPPAALRPPQGANAWSCRCSSIPWPRRCRPASPAPRSSSTPTQGVPHACCCTT